MEYAQFSSLSFTFYICDPVSSTAQLTTFNDSTVKLVGPAFCPATYVTVDRPPKPSAPGC